MKYPFFIPFIFISTGIILKELINIELPLIFLLILSLALIIVKREIALITLAIFSLVLGYSINEKSLNNIQNKKSVALQCKVIDIPVAYKKYIKFNCKVNQSDYKELLNKKVKVILFSKEPENLKIFLFSEVNLTGRLKLYKNSLNLYGYSYKIKNDNNPFIYLLELKNKLKENFKEKVDDKTLYSLGEALIFGDRGNIDTETRRIFVNSGLIHLLAISGLHVGMLITVLLIIFYPLKKEFRYIFVAILVAIFPFLTGLKIPVIRASLMGILILIGKIKNFRVNSLNILFFVGMVILIISPKSIFSPSFQLSFMAVLGILLFVEKHKLEMNNIYQYFYVGIIISVVATLFTTPILTYHFGKFSPISIVATPIALIPLYPYIALAVVNLLTGFNIGLLVDLMNKFGEIFVGITAFFGELKIFYIGYKPILFFTILILIYLIIIFLMKINLYLKLGSSILLLGLFLYFSKVDTAKSYSEYKVINEKKFILLKLNNSKECFVYLKRKFQYIGTILNKEGCEKRYLVINPKKKSMYLSEFDRYIPINTKFNNVQFIKVGKDILIKLGEKTVFSTENHIQSF